MPLAEVTTTGVSFWPEREALKTEAPFPALSVAEVVELTLALVFVVDDEVAGSVDDVGAEEGGLEEVEVESVALLPPNSVNPRTTTAAAKSRTTAANPNRRRPACFLRRPRSLRVRYRAGSGFTIPRTDDEKSAAFDLVRRA